MMKKALLLKKKIKMLMINLTMIATTMKMTTTKTKRQATVIVPITKKSLTIRKS